MSKPLDEALRDLDAALRELDDAIDPIRQRAFRVVKPIVVWLTRVLTGKK